MKGVQHLYIGVDLSLCECLFVFVNEGVRHLCIRFNLSLCIFVFVNEGGSTYQYRVWYISLCTYICTGLRTYVSGLNYLRVYVYLYRVWSSSVFIYIHIFVLGSGPLYRVWSISVWMYICIRKWRGRIYLRVWEEDKSSFNDVLGDLPPWWIIQRHTLTHTHTNTHRHTNI